MNLAYIIIMNVVPNVIKNCLVFSWYWKIIFPFLINDKALEIESVAGNVDRNYSSVIKK